MNNQNQNVKDRFLVKTSKQVAATTKKLQEIKQLLPDQMNLEDVGESIRKGTFKMSKKTEDHLDAATDKKPGDNSKDKKDDKNVDDGDVTDGCAMGVASGYLSRIKGQKEFLSSEKSQNNKLESKGVASSFLDKIKDQNPNQGEKKSTIKPISQNQVKIDIGSKPENISYSSMKASAIKDSLTKSTSSVKDAIASYKTATQPNVTKATANVDKTQVKIDIGNTPMNSSCSSMEASPVKNSATKSTSSVRDTIGSYQNAIKTTDTKDTANVKEGVLMRPSLVKGSENAKSLNNLAVPSSPVSLRSGSSSDLKNRISRDLNLVFSAKNRDSMGSPCAKGPNDGPIVNRNFSSSNLSKSYLCNVDSPPKDVVFRNPLSDNDNVFVDDKTTEKPGDNIKTDISANIDLDSILVTSERLSHLTANRSSLPKQAKKRRLPSRYSQR